MNRPLNKNGVMMDAITPPTGTLKPRRVRIIVADDDNCGLRCMADALQGLDVEIESAHDGLEAIEKARANMPDLCVLDVVMPRASGLDACRKVKALCPEKFIPVILVSSNGDVESKVAGLDVGADDYMAKPFHPAELRARVSAMLRIKAQQDKIIKRQHELELISLTDSLTGLANRRAMRQRLRDEFMRSQRYNDPLSVLMVDVDNFKKVNDQCGHQFGDQVLSELAGVLTHSCREVDLVFRYGGDEFVVVLPQTPFLGSLAVGERICHSVADRKFDYDGNPYGVTVSIGISFCPHTNVDKEDGLLSLADQALYQAKNEGRNRICLHQQTNYLHRSRSPGAAS